MRKAFLFVFLFFLFPSIIYAQSPHARKSEFYKAEVIHIIEEGSRKIGNKNNLFQNVELLIMEGPEDGKKIIIEYGGMFTITETQKLKKGDVVILSNSEVNGKMQYRIADTYRLNNLLYIFTGFFLLVLITAGRKGIGSFLGMMISLAVIIFFIIPQILNGQDPLLVSLTGSLFIMVITIYLAHGRSRQTSIAVLSTFISLVLTIAISIFLVKLSSLSGFGSEDIYALTQGFSGRINFQGLLLGGIIIGTLGVLDDITTTQTSVIFTLAENNHKLSSKDLFTNGMKIGREHIASLVNTLVLAYAGASIGVFIFLILGLRLNSQPLWVILNSEVIMEEIIRTIVGSTGLILAVPITTLLASFFAKYSLKIK